MNKSSNTRPSRFRKRLVTMTLFLFALFSLLIIQFYKIQILEGKKWERHAQNQHEFTVQEPFHRGTFFSNTSIKFGHPDIPQPFVIDVPKFHLYIDPDSIPPEHRDAIAEKFYTVLETPEEEKEKLRENFNRNSRSRKIKMRLDRETKNVITDWWFPFARKNKMARNAIFFVNDYQRSYPFGHLLGQVLHTIRKTKDETTKQGIPTGGLELYYNDFLKGKLGKRRLLRSPKHALATGHIIEAPENGADIYLTINHYLQAIAEEELKKGVRQSNAKGGWIIVMEPHTGEILAFAQYPFFSPPDYSYYYTDPSLIEHTKAKAITDSYEPASTLKLITLALCLKANKILKKRGQAPLLNLNKKIATSDGNFPGRRRPLKDGRIHYYLNASMAMQKSSNIYFAKAIHKVMEKFGAAWYREELINTFGFGTSALLPLSGEHLGKVPKPGALHPNGKLEWSKPTPYSLAIGHNIQANSIQVLRALNVFANGGYLVEPILVRKIIKKKDRNIEEVLLDNTSEKRIKVFPHVLDKDIINDVIKTVRYVTKWGGTSPKGNVNGYTEAGKSGTSKKIINGAYSNKHFLSSFFGFIPAKAPKLSILVAIDEPEPLFIPGVGKNHHGGQCAAPVFREVAKRSLEYLGIDHDDPHGYPKGDPRYDPEKTNWNIETRELKKLYDKWNKKRDT